MLDIVYSIIIPVKEINDYIRETVSYIQKLNEQKWELIILPNQQSLDEWGDDRIKLFSTDKVGPARKRDIGAKLAGGKYLVFFDDDSYPDADYFNTVDQLLSKKGVVALGGPAITPPHNTFWQRVSGAVFLSTFSGGIPERYISSGDIREIDDWPSVNFIVEKDAFLNVGGFDSPYWPGEDTKLCHDLVYKNKKKILYVPNMIVWHSRREGLASHLKQIGGYGIHRGYFVKKYPQTSLRLKYFIPTLFFLFVLATPLYLLLNELGQALFSIGWFFYICALIFAWIDLRRYETRTVVSFALIYTFFTHIWYGFKFLQGLFTSNLVSRLR